MSDLTAEGERLVDAWVFAKKHKADAEETVSRLTTQCMNAELALARWLSPDDAKPGEKFSVWYGADLIQVEIGGITMGGDSYQSSTRVTVRSRGKRSRV